MGEPTIPPASVHAYAETPPPEPWTPWREAHFCVVDLETTGLNPGDDEIVAFAALHIARGQVRLDDAVYQLVRPRRMPGRETVVIHGLRSADLIAAPDFGETQNRLLEALAGRSMVAHVASIETKFLGAALGKSGITLHNPVIDTEALAAELFHRRNLVGPRPLALGQVADTLGLPVHRPHEADGDALTTGQVFLALATHLDEFSPQTVGSLEKLSRHWTRERVPSRPFRRWFSRLIAPRSRR